MTNLPRAIEEQEQLTELAEQRDWLKNYCMDLGEGHLKANFDIEHGQHTYQLSLTYPVVFPDAPPMIKTRNGEKISGHQYGKMGELCLEHRPDNWHPDVTGAMMIESAYRLLSGENPTDDTGIQEVIDGHATSIGQEARSAFCRFVITDDDLSALNSLDKNTVIHGIISEIFQDKTFSARIMQIMHPGLPHSKPETVSSDQRGVCDVYIINQPSQKIPKHPSFDDFQACIEAANSDAFKQDHLKPGSRFCLLLSTDAGWRLRWIYVKEEKSSVTVYRTVVDPSLGTRLPEELQQLSGNKIGIVGCGSMGSKIAMHLARSGVGSFLLVDDDVLLEGNLVRHQLTSRDIGFHKTRALREQLLLVDSSLTVDTKEIRLGGQESSAFTVAAMEQLAGCDLIVDATAEPAAFNIIASICKKKKIPVVWGSVFAGGIGGIIGRAIPDKDPEPLEARNQVRRWCDSQEATNSIALNDNTPYGARGDQGEAMVATDADVSVIAAHVTRYATDALVNPESSNFPHSAYAIGLSRSWAFTDPFHVRPIIYLDQADWGSDEEMATKEDLLEFINNMRPEESKDVS